MALTEHTLTLTTKLPGTDLPLDGTWSVSVHASPPILKDTAGHVVYAGVHQVATQDGTLVLDLPATDNADADPAGFKWRVSFRSTNNKYALGPFVFDLTADATLDDIAEATDVAVTPSALTQAVEARDEAVAAAEAAVAVGTTNDTIIAGRIADPESETRTQLSAAYVGATAIADAAFGNDSTDAKNHFQTKMDALATAGGGELRIPRGTYRVSGPLFVPSNVTVRGEGASTVIKGTFSGSGLIYSKNHASTGDSNITVTDLCVDGNSTVNNGVVFAGVKYGTIHNVRVKRFTGYGIWVEASGEVAGVAQGTPSESVTVSACHVTETIDTGIETAYCKGVTVIGNTVEGTAGQGLYAWAGSQDVTFSGNTVIGVGTNELIGMRVGGLAHAAFPQQTARVVFTGNTLRNVKHGIKATGASGNVPSDVQLNNNSLHTAQLSSNGVELDYINRPMVQGTHIEGFITPFRVGDTALGHTPGSVVGANLTGNRVYNGGTSAFYGLTSGQFNNNQFVGLTNHGINFFGCSGMSIAGNSFADCGSANTTAMILQDRSGTPSSGNVMSGNRTVDTRATKWLGNVITLVGGADYNILTGNSAKGARSGAQAVQNATTGPTANNVIANNINP